jgi:hypothetical protein
MVPSQSPSIPNGESSQKSGVRSQESEVPHGIDAGEDIGSNCLAELAVANVSEASPLCPGRPKVSVWRDVLVLALVMVVVVPSTPDFMPLLAPGSWVLAPDF